MLRIRNSVEDREENVPLLRELGITPKAVFVMVLQAKDYVVLAGDG